MKLHRWPDFFIVGAARCGTTSLHEHLRRRDDVFMSKIKEPHYFAPCVRPHRGLRPVRGQGQYLALFRGARKHQLLGESSPSYLWCRKAAGRIREVAPDARIVILLRNPVERAFSHYLMDVRDGVQTRDFERALAEDQKTASRSWGVAHLYVDLGFYAQPLERYLTAFHPDHVKVLFFEDLVSDTPRILGELEKFLGVRTILTARQLPTQNAFAAPRGALARTILGSAWLNSLAHSVMPKSALDWVKRGVLVRRLAKPEMPAHVRAELEATYMSDIVRLESLLGRAAPWGIKSRMTAHP